MNVNAILAQRPFTLWRYPKQSQHISLQAWGAEDELAIKYLFERANSQNNSLGRTLILNDEFGALGCGLNELVSENSVWQTDSYISKRSFEENAKVNDVTVKFALLDSLQVLNQQFDTVVLRIPKNLNFLTHQLNALKACVSENTQIIALGKVKVVTKPVLKLFETRLGETRTSLAEKKARLIFCSPDDNLLQDTSGNAKAFKESRWSFSTGEQTPSLNVINLPNVFSSKSLDIGARFMLQSLIAFNNESILDLGCGNGVLGMSALALSKHCNVTFTDESYMAVESARRSVFANHLIGDTNDNTTEAKNRPNQTADFVVDNCLESLNKQNKHTSFDRVLCNPPFHQNNTITVHIAWQMFSDAKTHLHRSGKLWVVGNRHLGYHDKLKRLFGGVHVLASHPKFVILEAIKR